MNLADQAFLKAVEVLSACARPVGFYASGLKGGYEALWARDSMIASLGAALLGKKFQPAIKNSLKTLSRHQSSRGQIPNAVGSYNTERRSEITFNSIDSTLWYLIGNFVYYRVYRDSAFLRENARRMDRAFVWLQYQDPNEDGLLVQQPTMDWQDAFPHKYGRTINTQALYYAALKLYGNHELAEHVKKIVNGETQKYLSLYDKKRGYYLPWIWKTHGPEAREEEYWFDTFGNLLAILTGLASPKIAGRILNHIEKNSINRPYPCKAIFPPITKRDREWRDYFEMAESRKPYHYLNAGIWPFIGGFYVAALVKMRKFSKARKELELLAKANMKKSADPKWKLQKDDFGFQEWLHGRTGRVIGGSNPYQAWSAGAYVLAYKAVKNKKVNFL